MGGREGTCCTWGCRASRGLRGESVRLTRCHTPTRSNEGLHHPTPEQDIGVKTAQRWPQKVQNSSQPKHWEVWNIEDECWIFGENIVALWGFWVASRRLSRLQTISWYLIWGKGQSIIFRVQKHIWGLNTYWSVKLIMNSQQSYQGGNKNSWWQFQNWSLLEIANEITFPISLR